MEKKLLALVMVFGIAPLANALVLSLSLDGINPAPETVGVLAGQVLPIYVISDSDGVGYVQYISAGTNSPVTISNVQSYPAAGDLANAIDLGGYFELVADDSADNIQAGKHFSFDITIDSYATPGTWEYVQLHNSPIPDDTVRLNVVPEPATITVDDDGPADFNTIQAAIDVAYDGDTVLVADGTYTGPGNRSIDFRGKAITVRSESGPENCIIDCQKAGRGFYFHNFEDANSVITGFTITNGHTARQGGGISCSDSSPTITNCTITGNSALYNGGGIYCLRGRAGGGSPTIIDCTITGNSAGTGGGIYCYGGSPTITNCTISGNTTKEWVLAKSGGGGIYCEGYLELSSSPIISNCIITGNSSDDAGGGIFCEDSSLTITNCTISSNLAKYVGGGIECRSNSTITNCILRENLPQQITGNPSVVYSDIQGSWPGEGNIDADPLFVEPGYWADANDPNIIAEPNDPNAIWVEGDYHLLRTSPCVDAGTDANVYTDIEGNIRPFDFPGVDNNGELPEFDMGAYELVPIEAEMKLVPQTLNCNSKGKYVKAHLTLPEGFLPEDVDVNESAIAEPMGIDSESIKVLGAGTGPVKLEICFDREAFCETITETGEVEITVIGSLTTSRYFYATDTIKIKPRR